MNGLSLRSTIRDPHRRPKRALELEATAPLFEGDIPVNAWDQPYSRVRTDRYTYVVYRKTGEEEMYDRARDPYQLDNVAGDPGYAQVKAALATKLARLADCRGRACDVEP